MPSLPEAAFDHLAGLEPFPEPPLLALSAPVVLMHGFGIVAAVQRGGHLHGEAMHLRSRGVRAYAPNVPPYSTIQTRAEQWNARLRHVLDETGADALHLIAQSMGGLDARYLISRCGWHDRVLTLTTISTPHHGTSAAEFVLEQPHLLRDWLAEVFDWMGAHALPEDTAADFQQTLRELTPDYVQNTFNPRTPDHSGVQYHSYAGCAGKGTDIPLNPFLKIPNRVIYQREGINDGFVATESAHWEAFEGLVKADHVRQVGLTPDFSGTPEIDAFYRSIVQRLIDKGF